MKQAIMTAPGRIELRRADAPEVGPGQVRLRVRRIGICGSDVHVYHGTHPCRSYPTVQGHEFCATVESVGEGVAGLAAGEKVTALPQRICGRCRACLRGDYHICDRLQVSGFGPAGAAQELFVVDADMVVPLPEAFSFEQGALVEPAAVAAHAMARGGEVAGRNVVVLGAGPIGNLVAQTARSAGAEVLITDLSDYRLDVATRCGVAHVANAASEPLAEAAGGAFGEDGFDVAFECVGEAIQAVEAIAAGRIATDPLISKHFDLEQFAEAYDFIERAGKDAMKVFIDL